MGQSMLGITSEAESETDELSLTHNDPNKFLNVAHYEFMMGYIQPVIHFSFST